MRIGEVARLLGVTPKTIRHYHKLGLISEPMRADNGYRQYDTADLLALQRIRQFQTLGFPLRQINAIMRSADPDAAVQNALVKLRHDIEVEQQKLHKRHAQIEAFLAKGSTLADIEQPPMPSPTYQFLEKSERTAHDLPDALLEFDRKLFARLDVFHWSKEYETYWQAMLEQFAQPKMHDALQTITHALIQAADMPPSDERLEQLAQHVMASGTAQLLIESAHFLSPPDEPFPEVFSQLAEQVADTQLSDSQLQLIQRLAELTRSL